VVSAAIVGYFLQDVNFGAVKGVKTWRLVSTRGKILRKLELPFECLQSWFMLADFCRWLQALYTLFYVLCSPQIRQTREGSKTVTSLFRFEDLIG
jgi:hypothetical protein